MKISLSLIRAPEIVKGFLQRLVTAVKKIKLYGHEGMEVERNFLEFT